MVMRGDCLTRVRERLRPEVGDGARNLAPDDDFDGGVRPEMIAVMSMMLREPVVNAPPNSAIKSRSRFSYVPQQSYVVHPPHKL